MSLVYSCVDLNFYVQLLFGFCFALKSSKCKKEFKLIEIVMREKLQRQEDTKSCVEEKRDGNFELAFRVLL